MATVNVAETLQRRYRDSAGAALTGLTPTCTIAPSPGAVPSTALTVTEIGQGWYGAAWTPTQVGRYAYVWGESSTAAGDDSDDTVEVFGGGVVSSSALGWTYSGDPSTSARDLLRFDIGDTDENSPLLQDTELNYVIDNQSSQHRRVADCFERIGRKILQRPNFALDKWREDRHDVAKSFLEQAKELRKRGAAAGLYAGGISKADKLTREQDTDRDEPFAYIGMDEFPGLPDNLSDDDTSDD